MLPTFIIAGVEKSGSTSLYNYLSQHDDVFMSPVKEPNFFKEPVTPQRLSQYEALFDGVTDERAIGEASVGYFNDPDVAARIRETIPDIRILVVLRNPIERAYSHYNMLVEHAAVPNISYLDVLKRAKKTQDYRLTGVPTSRYASSLRSFKSAFRDRLHVYLFDEYKKFPIYFIQKIYFDIGIDSRFIPDMKIKYNKSYLPRNSFILSFLSNKNTIKDTARSVLPSSITQRVRSVLQNANQTPVPPLSVETRTLLLDLLRDDIEQTEELLQRDLSQWKQV